MKPSLYIPHYFLLLFIKYTVSELDTGCLLPYDSFWDMPVKCIGYEPSELPNIVLYNLAINNSQPFLKGTWQRGGFSGVFAEIGSA